MQSRQTEPPGASKRACAIVILHVAWLPHIVIARLPAWLLVPAELTNFYNWGFPPERDAGTFPAGKNGTSSDPAEFSVGEVLLGIPSETWGFFRPRIPSGTWGFFQFPLGISSGTWNFFRNPRVCTRGLDTWSCHVMSN